MAAPRQTDCQPGIERRSTVAMAPAPAASRPRNWANFFTLAILGRDAGLRKGVRVWTFGARTSQGPYASLRAGAVGAAAAYIPRGFAGGGRAHRFERRGFGVSRFAFDRPCALHPEGALFDSAGRAYLKQFAAAIGTLKRPRGLKPSSDRREVLPNAVSPSSEARLVCGQGHSS